MGGPAWMGGPQGPGAMAMPRHARRGTSKMVPVVVSAGLAVGVFCGLLFGVGTGKKRSAAAPSASNVKKVAAADDEPAPQPGAAPKGLGATPTVSPKLPPSTSGGTSGAVATQGSAAVVAQTSGTATPPVAPVAPVKKLLKLTFKVTPDAAAKSATVTIDGKPVSGLTTELAHDRKAVTYEIKADGYRSVDKKLDLLAGDEMTVEVELQKKSTSGGVRPPRRPDRPTNAGPAGGGLIDI